MGRLENKKNPVDLKKIQVAREILSEKVKGIELLNLEEKEIRSNLVTGVSASWVFIFSTINIRDLG